MYKNINYFIVMITMSVLLVLALFFYGCRRSLVMDSHDYASSVDIDFTADYMPKECKYIVVHTSDNYVPTKINKTNGRAYFDRVADERGFPTGSYHYAIYEDGSVDTLVKLNMNKYIEYWEKTCGVAGYNSVSIHIVYVGGKTRWTKYTDTRTPAQKLSMMKLIVFLQPRFPKAAVVSHNELNPDKPCPNFKASQWYQTMKL